MKNLILAIVLSFCSIAIKAQTDSIKGTQLYAKSIQVVITKDGKAPIYTEIGKAVNIVIVKNDIKVLYKASNDEIILQTYNYVGYNDKRNSVYVDSLGDKYVLYLLEDKSLVFVGEADNYNTKKGYYIPTPN